MLKATEEFFNDIFPQLDNEYIEIRPFYKEHTDYEHRSFCNSIEKTLYHIEQIPRDREIYFGIATRSNTKGGKIEDLKTFYAIGFDYDLKDSPGLTADQILQQYKSMDLKPAYIVNSGHGYHVYLLLKPSKSCKLIKLILNEIAVRTKADLHAKSLAQILRVPGTFNNKRGEHIPVTIVHKGDKCRYDIKDLQTILNISEPKENVTQREISSIDNIIIDRPCVKTIYMGVPEGQRNFALGRLTKYFKSKGFTKEKTWQIIKEWNTRNRPPENMEKLQKDFNIYWHGNYSLLGCSINDSDLQAILSEYCSKGECILNVTTNTKIELDNAVSYNNRIFNTYKALSGNDLIVFGVLIRHKEGLNTGQLVDKLYSKAAKSYCMTRKTLISCLKQLKAKGLIEIIPGNKRSGKQDFYKFIAQGTYGMGYTLLSNGAINGAIDKRITPAQLKLYLLLMRYAFSKGSCFPSENSLSKELRISQQAVSKMIRELEQADYIKIQKQYTETGTEINLYKLLV